MIIALDPGTAQTGFVVFDGARVRRSGVLPNPAVLAWLRSAHQPEADAAEMLAIEWVESFGMAVGREVFETVRWIGRFQEAWHEPEAVLFVPRRLVKLELCQSARAKDSNIRCALIDMFGPGKEVAIGTKSRMGPLYGVRSHAMSALAVAVTCQRQQML